MKKSLKIAALFTTVLGIASIAYAKNQAPTVWACLPGTTGVCLPDFFEPENNDCFISPFPIQGDCGGIVKIVKPIVLP